MSWLNSGMPVHIQTDASAPIVPQSHQPSQAIPSLQSRPSLPEEGPDALGVLPGSLTTPAGTYVVPVSSATSQPTSSSSALPTTSSDEKKRAPLACHSCRGSKIRCDGERPICKNCVKRRAPCNYDAIIKRRGPDRKPGTRVRGPNGTTSKRQGRAHPYRAIRSADADDSASAEAPPSTSAPARPAVNNRTEERIPQQFPSPPPPLEHAGVHAGRNRGSNILLPHLPPLQPPNELPPLYAPRLISSLPSHDAVSFELLNPQPQVTVGVQPYASAYPLPVNNAVLDITPYEGPEGQFYSQNQSVYQPAHALNLAPQDWQALGVASSSYYTPQHAPASILVVDHQYQYSQASSGESTDYDTESTSPVEDTTIAKEPSLRFSQDTWWDTVLFIYDPTSKRQAATAANADLHMFFRSSSSWLSFINVSLFFNMFYHPEQRAMMQPALVLGCLSFAAHMLGSDMEGGEKQRRKALKLRELGLAAFDASYNAGWIDIPLAQASWLFTLYENCAHPDSSMARMASSMILMDNVIHALRLTSTDAANTRAPFFRPNTVPVMGRCAPEAPNIGQSFHPLSGPSASSGRSIQYHMTTEPTPFDSYREVTQHSHAGPVTRHCPCAALAMQSVPDQARPTPLWMMVPKWERDAPDGVLRLEEGRRLVWSALALVSGDVTGRLVTRRPFLDLELVKPQNFGVLYPGESLYSKYAAIDAVYSGKESTWALYARAVHLWVTCTKYRDVASSSHDKADFAMKTWMETVAIEDALNEHNCDGEKATMYQAREYIFVIRMYISYQYRRFIPIPQSGVNFSRLDRGRAMQWLQHQNNTALQLRAVAMADPNSFSAKLLIRRPYLIWWQMAQIWRALILFEMDNSLTFAVDVVLNILPVLLFMQEMWPCIEQRQQAMSIMDSLHAACQKTGRTVPPFTFHPQPK